MKITKKKITKIKKVKKTKKTKPIIAETIIDLTNGQDIDYTDYTFEREVAKQPTLKRIEMEFSDGSIQLLSGDTAQKWLEAVNGAILMGQIHGIPFPHFEWNKVKA